MFPPKNFESDINTDDQHRTHATSLGQVMKRKRCLLVGRHVPKLKDIMANKGSAPKHNKRYGLREDQDQFYLYHDRPSTLAS